MPKQTRRKQRRSRKKQRGGVHLLPGSLVKLKPEKAEAFIEANRKQFMIPNVPLPPPDFRITPDDTFVVSRYTPDRKYITTNILLGGADPSNSSQIDGFTFTMTLIPVSSLIALPYNNRIGLSEIPNGTLVSQFTDLSTAQRTILHSETIYKVLKHIGIAYWLVDSADMDPESKKTIVVFRNQIVMPDDPTAFVPTRAELQTAYATFAGLPQIEALSEKVDALKGLMKSNTDELVSFRVLKQHYGNCWSDSVFTILFETTAIQQYILPILFEMIDYEAANYGTTIVGADPTLLPAVTAHIKQRFHLEEIPDLVLTFFMNGFQRYINKIIQYRKLDANRAAGTGASLAPTASLDVQTAEYYQTCFHPRKLKNGANKGYGGDFAYDLLSPLHILLKSLAPGRILIESTLKRDPAKPGVGFKTLSTIPEAYYCMIKNIEKGAAPVPGEQHKNHAVALFRKLELPELPEGVWYFYDDNFGVYKLPLEYSLVLNGLQVRELFYSTTEKIWTIRMKTKDQILKFSFGDYPWDFNLTQQIYVFRIKIDS